MASRNPSSAAFHDVYNLRTQGVVNDEELQRLMPYLTVYNGTSRVHMQSAPELILRSIPGLDAAAGARLAATRDLKSMQNDRHTSLSARFTAKAGPVFHLVLEGRAESGAVAHRAAIVSQFPKGHTVLAYGEAWEPLQ